MIDEDKVIASARKFNGGDLSEESTEVISAIVSAINAELSANKRKKEEEDHER